MARTLKVCLLAFQIFSAKNLNPFAQWSEIPVVFCGRTKSVINNEIKIGMVENHKKNIQVYLDFLLNAIIMQFTYIHLF